MCVAWKLRTADIATDWLRSSMHVPVNLHRNPFVAIVLLHIARTTISTTAYISTFVYAELPSLCGHLHMPVLTVPCVVIMQCWMYIKSIEVHVGRMCHNLHSLAL